MADQKTALAPVDEFNFAGQIFDKDRKKKTSNCPPGNKSNNMGRKETLSPTGLNSKSIEKEKVKSKVGQDTSLSITTSGPVLDVSKNSSFVTSKAFNEFKTEMYEMQKNSIMEIQKSFEQTMAKSLRQPQVVEKLNVNKKRNRVDSDISIDDISDSDEYPFNLTQQKFKKKRISNDDDILDQIDSLLDDASDQGQEMIGPNQTISSTDRPTVSTSEKSRQDETNDDQFADIFDEYIVTEKVGSGINPKISALATQLFSSKTPESKLCAIMDKYPRPSNVDIHSQIVNKGMWSNLKSINRSRDIKVIRVMDRLIKGSYAVMTLVDKQFEAKKQNKSNERDISSEIKIAMDALTLFGSSAQELNQIRRDCFKSDLNTKYKPLCYPSNNAEVGTSQFLFGDEFEKRIKELKESQQVGTSISSHGFQSYNPKGYSKYGNKGKAGSFLYQGSQSNINYKRNQTQHKRNYNPKYQKNQQTKK